MIDNCILFVPVDVRMCWVCGRTRDRCVCGKMFTELKPCTCNPHWCVGGGVVGCPDCDGRGWVEKNSDVKERTT
jgi:hypothetical protein